MERTLALIDALRRQIAAAVIGKPEAIDLLLTGLLARGHVLIEDVPGLGKTTLARSLARAVSGTFSRVQFTPDLLPSDILGTGIYHAATGEFTWRAGPLFANIVLADEINRATPRTQAALLEAMSEGSVTADGVTRALPRPFMVVATQNPLEHAGTYPLPESQLDRFTMRFSIGYPSTDDERQVLTRFGGRDAALAVQPAASPADVEHMQAVAAAIRVDPAVTDYILAILAETRRHPRLVAGASPRAGMALYACAQSFALISGRSYVLPDDVKRLATPVLAHRMLDRGGDRRNGGSASTLAKVLEKVPAPV